MPYAFYAQPVGSAVLRLLRDDRHTAVAPAGPASPLAADFPRPGDVIRRRFDDGARCYAATVKGEFAGFIWICREAYEEDEVRCRYVLPSPDRCVWDFDVYVEPRFRVGRTLGRLWKAVGASLESEGVEWSFSRISLFNEASVGAHERLGALRVARALFFVVGRLQLTLCSQAPYVHLGVSGRPRIELRLPKPPVAPATASVAG